MKKWHQIVFGIVATGLIVCFLAFWYMCSIFQPTIFHSDRIEVGEVHTLETLEGLKQQLETNGGMGCKLSDGQILCWFKRTQAVTKVGSSRVIIKTDIGNCWGSKRVPDEHTELVSTIKEYYQIEGDEF